MFERGFEPNFKNLFVKAIQDYSGLPWNSEKDVREFVITKIKNNGGLHNQLEGSG